MDFSVLYSSPIVANPNDEIADADLPTTIALLNDLISSATKTFTSLSTTFSSSSAALSGLSQCQFDSRHKMPPEYHFHHSLRCRNSPASFSHLNVIDLLQMLRYPKSFKSEADLQKENKFVQPLLEVDADLCFSLDAELGDIGVGSVSSWFYRDCPGVVSFPEVDAASRNFTLPGFLSAECANFVCGLDGKGGNLSSGVGVEILSSELWVLRDEVHSWKGFPKAYSYTVLRVILCLHSVKESGLLKWVMVNSPKYGIVIDAPMRDHVFLLLRLCLKVILRESQRSLGLFSHKESGVSDGRREISFDCPCLCGSMTWLSSQLSILYGEKNGSLFALNMLKETLLQAGSRSLLFPFDDDNCKEGDHLCSGSLAVSGDESADLEVNGERESVKDRGSNSFGKVFVSQVASAIAALHERSILEKRILESPFIQMIPKYQWLNEHIYTSARANEERARRPNYLALLEHDGLMWHQSHNHQDHGIPKTREELLAQERDYKRRRSSYRGKKVKRNPTEVLHDIINEHMEEIRQAGGIGLHVKGSTDSEKQHLDCRPKSNLTSEFGDVKCNGDITLQQSKRVTYPYGKPTWAEYNKASGLPGDVDGTDQSNFAYLSDTPREPHGSRNMSLKPRIDHHRFGESSRRYCNKDKRNREYVLVSPSRSSSCRDSQDRYGSQDQDEERHGRHTAHSVKFDDGQHESNARSNFSDDQSTGYRATSDSKTSKRGRNFNYHKDESQTHNIFEDRYDPINSYNGYEGSFDFSSSPVGYDALASLKTDTKESPRHSSSHRRRQSND